MAKKEKALGYNTTIGERSSYALYFLGQNLFYGLIAFNMQTLYADIGITAATIAVIMLITKIWDAVNDPLFGILIDKIRFKKGRFMPWIRLSLPLIALSSLLMFLVPTGASMGVKIAWCAISYIAWDMSYTICDVPIFVLPTSMTDNIKERTSILALGRYLAMFGIMLPMMLLPMMQKRLGWAVCGIFFTILGALFMLPLCFKGKERHIVRPEKDITLRQMSKYVLGNKFLLIFYAGMFLYNVTNFGMTLSIFFARYNLGNQDIASILNLLTIIPMLIIGAFIPTLTKRIDKFTVYFFCQAAAAVLGVVRFFVGYENLGAFYAIALLQAVFASATGILIFMFTPDCLEYGTYHTGERAEGIAASVQTFFTKLSGSVTAPLAMLFIAMFGFVTGENAIQTPTAQAGIWLGITIVPAAGILLGLVLLRFYKLRDKDVQVMAQYNNRQITKQEAEAQLAAKYGPAAQLPSMTVNANG